MGMTWEQYWFGDVTMVQAFAEAERLRQQRQNSEAWLQGMYVYDALLRVAPVLQAFAPKGTKPQPYVPKPYEPQEQAGDNTANEQQMAENERLKAVLFFKNWARAAQNHFKE